MATNFDEEFGTALGSLEERVELVEITIDVLRERLENLSRRIDNFYSEIGEEE